MTMIKTWRVVVVAACKISSSAQHWISAVNNLSTNSMSYSRDINQDLIYPKYKTLHPITQDHLHVKTNLIFSKETHHLDRSNTVVHVGAALSRSENHLWCKMACGQSNWLPRLCVIWKVFGRSIRHLISEGHLTNMLKSVMMRLWQKWCPDM